MERKCINHPSLSISTCTYCIPYLRYLLRCESQESTLTYLGSNKRLGDSDLWYCTYLMLAYVALHSPTKQQCMCLCRKVGRWLFRATIADVCSRSLCFLDFFIISLCDERLIFSSYYRYQYIYWNQTCGSSERRKRYIACTIKVDRESQTDLE